MRRRVLFMIVCIINVMVLMISCQSTPEDSLIVNKTDDNINSLIQQQADGPVITDGHITETITCCGDKVLANVDADIKSKFDYYGVYEIKRKEITQQQVDKAIEILYGDNQIFDMRGQKMTKADYDFYINRAEEKYQDMIDNPEKYKKKIENGENSAYSSYDEWLKARKNRIDEMKKEREKAPDSEEDLKKDLNTKLHKDKLDNYEAYSVRISADLGFKNDAYLRIINPIDQIEREVSLEYSNGAETDEYSVTLKCEQAQSIADNFVSQIDDTLKLYKYGQSESGWEFEYCVVADGMPISKCKVSSEYSYIWSIGKMTIVVDDSGINFINWTQPIEVVKKVTEKVNMISAEEAYDVFARYFKLKYASDSLYDYGIEKQIFDVYEISVSYVIEPVKDSTDVARVMPCWDFICKHTLKFNDGTPDNIAERASIFAINAIDKSVILN